VRICSAYRYKLILRYTYISSSSVSGMFVVVVEVWKMDGQREIFHRTVFVVGEVAPQLIKRGRVVFVHKPSNDNKYRVELDIS
jgi:hypothetical protein